MNSHVFILLILSADGLSNSDSNGDWTFRIYASPRDIELGGEILLWG